MSPEAQNINPGTFVATVGAHRLQKLACLTPEEFCSLEGITFGGYSSVDVEFGEILAGAQSIHAVASRLLDEGSDLDITEQWLDGIWSAEDEIDKGVGAFEFEAVVVQDGVGFFVNGLVDSEQTDTILGALGVGFGPDITVAATSLKDDGVVAHATWGKIVSVDAEAYFRRQTHERESFRGLDNDCLLTGKFSLFEKHL